MLDTSAVLQLYSLLSFWLLCLANSIFKPHSRAVRGTHNVPGPRGPARCARFRNGHTEHTLTHSRLQNKNFNTPAEACLVSARHSARQNTKADSVLALRTTSSIIHTSYIANQPHPAASTLARRPHTHLVRTHIRVPIASPPCATRALASLGGIAYHDEPL